MQIISKSHHIGRQTVKWRRHLSIVPLIINGKEIVSKNLQPVTSVDSSVIHQYSCLVDLKSTVPEICSTSLKGFKEWSSKDYVEKREIFKTAVELLKKNKQAISQAHREIGVPKWFSDFNVDGIIHQTEEYMSQLSNADGILPKSHLAKLALVKKQPIGPVLSISPWNAPGILSGRSILAPLAAGCSVVAKGSEKSPLVTYLVTKCFLDAGVPPAALQVVNVEPKDAPEFTELMLSNNAIKKVNFTGSTAVGRDIAVLAARNLKPYLLELGGKNFSLVERDADLLKAAETIIWASWAHKGQICMSTDKVYVHEQIYDEFSIILAETAAKMTQDPDYLIPQRDDLLSQKVSLLVEDSLLKGGEILFGEYPNNTDPNIIKPIILKNINSDMLIDSVESFGPLFTVHKYEDLEKTIEQLNNEKFGLKASVWTKDVLKGLEIASKIEAGGVHVNMPTIHDEPTIPHGGIKDSGTGRFNSIWGIDEFSFIKSITVS